MYILTPIRESLFTIYYDQEDQQIAKLEQIRDGKGFIPKWNLF